MADTIQDYCGKCGLKEQDALHPLSILSTNTRADGSKLVRKTCRPCRNERATHRQPRYNSNKVVTEAYEAKQCLQCHTPVDNKYSRLHIKCYPAYYSQTNDVLVMQRKEWYNTN